MGCTRSRASSSSLAALAIMLVASVVGSYPEPIEERVVLCPDDVAHVEEFHVVDSQGMKKVEEIVPVGEHHADIKAMSRSTHSSLTQALERGPIDRTLQSTTQYGAGYLAKDSELVSRADPSLHEGDDSGALSSDQDGVDWVRDLRAVPAALASDDDPIGSEQSAVENRIIAGVGNRSLEDSRDTFDGTDGKFAALGEGAFISQVPSSDINFAHEGVEEAGIMSGREGVEGERVPTEGVKAGILAPSRKEEGSTTSPTSHLSPNRGEFTLPPSGTAVAEMGETPTCGRPPGDFMLFIFEESGGDGSLVANSDVGKQERCGEWSGTGSDGGCGGGSETECAHRQPLPNARMPTADIPSPRANHNDRGLTSGADTPTCDSFWGGLGARAEAVEVMPRVSARAGQGRGG
ncbi:unnamed protein product, partial [Discosporangium mesarthrocarpum]